MASNARTIAFFNNKGGVSKTTTCFHVGWKLSQLGKRVVLVDADPQCNLTGLSLEIADGGVLPDSYQQFEKVNLHNSLLPVMKSMGKKIESPDCNPIAGNDNLRLLPGSVKMAEVETQLATAMNMGSMMPAMQNVPGSFSELYRLAAERYSADYVLVDMSPSLGAINQINFLNADYFIVPMMPDVFSVMAVDSLSQAIPRWIDWTKRVRQLGMFDDEDILYTFKPKDPKFLGTVVQKYRLRNGMPSKSFEVYFNHLDEAVHNVFIPALEKVGLSMDPDLYWNHTESYKLAQIPDFNSLIATSQEKHKPVFELQHDDLFTGGAAAVGQLDKVRDFDRIFTDFAQRIISLTAE
ncbi:AAA family ATPase [Gordonia sp. ABSL1-1]|uniref:ParA family protein n=1 Tax=Gordonia sp. ABSL1-1 TaxID=3053923 RepID=UPI00257468A9|nr:AAA family ATPase [Gordonia sp. ABSL1-1]MDL9938430.1 AAA family ATPase [Gordonia sp. ABSL1-1]